MAERESVAPNFVKATPAGDDRVRDICGRCGFIDYRNPKIVVGSVLSYEGAVLLCRRAIDPRRGFWTLPAGYLEIGESVEDGARREAYEEARVTPIFDQVLAVYSVPRISQVQILFRGRLETPDFAPGPESLDVRLFEWVDIPWPDLAFPTVGWALRHWRESADRTGFSPFANPLDGL
jgi:ADP-ribose pyrophosphatase YjhB (NUDIX family)